jgi:hypothetical protein
MKQPPCGMNVVASAWMGIAMAGQDVDRLRRDLDREGLGPWNDVVVDASTALTRQVIAAIEDLQRSVRDYPLISVLLAVELGFVVGRGFGRRRNAPR